MTNDDFAKVILVAYQADGNCYWCFRKCMNEAVALWPDTDWLAAWDASDYTVTDRGVRQEIVDWLEEESDE